MVTLDRVHCLNLEVSSVGIKSCLDTFGKSGATEKSLLVKVLV